MPVQRLVLGGLKARRDAGKARRWAWKQFSSTGRRDGHQLSHWVRADAEFSDYPFARFNKRLDIVRYTDAEYDAYLTPSPEHFSDPNDHDARWPREHTDHLFDLCRRFDLRWPIIADRFELKPPRAIEDLKVRELVIREARIQLQLSPTDPHTLTHCRRASTR